MIHRDVVVQSSCSTAGIDCGLAVVRWSAEVDCYCVDSGLAVVGLLDHTVASLGKT